MSDQGGARRRRMVLATAKRLLDVPDSAPLEELQAAVEVLGIDPNKEIARIRQFVREQPKRLLEEARLRHRAEQEAFERFQQQLADTDITALQGQIRSAMTLLAPGSAARVQAHYRELSEKTGEDARSELVDLLWELTKNAAKEPR